MREVGKLVKCDNCKQWVFLKRLDDIVMDGGYSRSENYEKLPDGWERADVVDKHADLCPECARTLRSVIGYQMPVMTERIGIEVPHDET